MSYRKSLIKKGFLGHFGLGLATKQSFIEFATRFQEIFEGVCGPSTVRIELYTKVPYFSSFTGSDGEMQAQKRFNEEGMQVLADLSELPDNFSEIPYARVLFRPQDDDNAPRSSFGVVHFGNRLPDRILFYAQPEEVAQVMEEQLLPDGKAPSGFVLGDGFEDNARRYVPGSVIGNSALPEMLVSINLENRAPSELWVSQ